MWISWPWAGRTPSAAHIRCLHARALFSILACTHGNAPTYMVTWWYFTYCLGNISTGKFNGFANLQCWANLRICRGTCPATCSLSSFSISCRTEAEPVQWPLPSLQRMVLARKRVAWAGLQSGRNLTTHISSEFLTFLSCFDIKTKVLALLVTSLCWWAFNSPKHV